MNLIPSPDPFGLPAPVWLLLTLLVVTQTLHIVFMNYVLGGSWLLLWLALGGEAWKRALYSRCLNVLPVALSIAITFGVAPLLFVQVVYGHFFYVANVLMGWFWLLILALVLIAFYSVYALKARRGEGEGTSLLPQPLRVTLHLGIALCFTLVALLFTTNAVLTTHPALWEAARTGSPILAAWGGAWMTLPRFLHNLGGAFLVTGLWVVWIATLRGGEEEAEKGARLGARIATLAAVFQIGAGVLYAFTLPGYVLKRLLLMQSPAAWILGLGIALALLLFLRLLLLFIAPQNRVALWVSSVLAAGLLLAMTAASEFIRQELLLPDFSLAQWPIKTQPGPLGMFLGFFIAGLAVIVFLAKVTWDAHNPRPPVEAPPAEAESPGVGM
jgi:hypothetical protein